VGIEQGDSAKLAGLHDVRWRTANIAVVDFAVAPKASWISGKIEFWNWLILQHFS
jgi:hypothetical protein